MAFQTQKIPQEKNLFENLIPSQNLPAGSMKVTPYSQGFDAILESIQSQLLLISSILSTRGIFPITQERIARMDLSGSSVVVKFGPGGSTLHASIPRVGANPIDLSIADSEKTTTFTLDYGSGGTSHIVKEPGALIVHEFKA